MVGVVGVVSQREQPLEGRAVRDIVIPLPALLLHHVALDVQLLLRQGREKVTHAVGLEPQAEGQVIGWQCLEVIRPIKKRRPIQDATDRLHVPEVLVVSNVLRAGKEHVLEQMSKTGAARTLVLRADVVPEVDRYKRGGVVFVENDAEAVGKCVGFELEHWRRLYHNESQRITTMNDEG